jgi:hypothetical protein
MRVVIALVAIALLFGAVGLIVRALRWLIILALIAVALGAFSGYRQRS